MEIQFKMSGNTVVYSTHAFFWRVALTHQEPHQTSRLIIPRVTVGLVELKGLFKPRINSMILCLRGRKMVSNMTFLYDLNLSVGPGTGPG